MPSNLNLDYYYGNEAEQYSFYRVPKTLLTDPRYKSVSIEAKVLYGLLLDRMGLSVKNGWMDSDGRVYIYFTQEDAMTLMNCGKDKATKLFRELDMDGIGLIERKKQGQGRPARIYVKNFILPPEPGQTLPDPPTPTLGAVQTAENPQSETPEIKVSHAAEAQQAGSRDFSALLTAEKPQSALPEIRSQDSDFSAPNNTERNKTYKSDTDPSISPPTPATRDQPPAGRSKRGMRMDEIEAYRELIQENIDYDLLLQDHPNDSETLEGYLELMVEVCCSRRDFIRIAGNEIAAEAVKSRFLKLNREHIEYVLESMNKNTTLIRNIKAYTLAALYNAPTTISQFYASLVSHDMAQNAAGI